MIARLVRPLLVLLAVGLSLAIDRSVVGVIIALFVIVVPFEKLFPRHRGQRIRRPALATDLTFALSSPVLNIVGIALAVVIGVVSLAWLPGLLFRPLVGRLPEASLPFVGLVVFDFLIYWVHRWSHEVPFFWRFHAIHHSTETLDWVSGFRSHPFDGVILAPPFFFLLAAGFSPEVSGALVVVQIVTGLFLHANVRWRLRPLHRVVITPEFHHWHHANELDALNRNYSVFLPLWDVVFGTYFMPKDRRPQVYGVSEVVPAGFVAQLRHPLRGMDNPLVLAARTFRHPIETMRNGAGLTRSLLVDIKLSTLRPTAAR